MSDAINNSVDVAAVDYRLFCEPLDWADIRQFLVKRKLPIADAMGLSPSVFHKICDGDIRWLPRRLMRECSLWIDGYEQAELNQAENSIPKSG